MFVCPLFTSVVVAGLPMASLPGLTSAEIWNMAASGQVKG